MLDSARALRERGEIATVLPMAKNIRNQIEKLEAEGYRRFEKVFE